MENIFINQILKQNKDFVLISALDSEYKERLKNHIKMTILEKYPSFKLENLQEMINEVIDDFENIYGINAINYISSINYKIDDFFYEKLNEPYQDHNNLEFDDYDSKLEIPLNKYTLMDWIEFDYIDSIDLYVKDFHEADVWKKHPYFNDYKENMEQYIEWWTYYINLDEGYEKELFIRDLQNSKLIVMENSKLKKMKKKLTKREITLISAYAIFVMTQGIELTYKEKIAKDYNINKNTPQTNQELLNNSYDVIIDNIKKFPNTNEIIILLEGEKSNNDNLFTNSKKLSKLKNNNHYMSFLYKCNSVYTDNHLIVFQEFVEALISGYMQYLEFENKEQKIKKHTQDLEVLKRYNSANENDKNIKELEDKISFLSIPKPHEKFIPFKELSNRLEIDINRISNYITNISNNGTHPNTIKQHFGSLKTISKEICISRF